MDLRAPCFRSAVKTGWVRLLRALSKKVFCGAGETVLMLLQARPSRPELLLSEVKALETFFADSTAWDLTVRPPMLTTSV